MPSEQQKVSCINNKMKFLKFRNGCLIPDKHGNRMLIDVVSLCDQDGKHIRNLAIKEAYEMLIHEGSFLILSNPKFDEVPVEAKESVKSKKQ